MGKKREAQACVRRINEDAKTIEFVASTDYLASDGLSIRAEAWEDGMEQFMRNPVIPFWHDYSDLPAGKAVAWRIEPDVGLILDVQFATDINPKAAMAFELYRGGYMNAGSVGFDVIEANPVKEEDSGRSYMDVTKAQLLEFSVVPVPADPGALAIRSAKPKEAWDALARLLAEPEEEPKNEEPKPAEEEERKGAVLSADNLELVTAAIKALEAVKAAAQKAAAEPEEEEKPKSEAKAHDNNNLPEHDAEGDTINRLAAAYDEAEAERVESVIDALAKGKGD